MRVGILGATGAVGRQMLQCLEERKLPVEEIRLFASEKSRGLRLPFQGEEVEVQTPGEHAFDGLDFVLGAAENPVAQEMRPRIAKAGAVFVDNSSAFRLEADVPLVVPEINGQDAFKHHGVLANPNCTTIIAAMAMAPIGRLARLDSVVATTFQAVSGAGLGGMQELSEQMEALRLGEEIRPKVFSRQIAYNAIAEIGGYDALGYTSEEMKMQNEGRKILGLPDLKVNCTCVRIPVLRSHSVSLLMQMAEPVSLEKVREALQTAPGLRFFEKEPPTPLDTSDQDLVFVGRLRKDLISEQGISLWCCGDQIRKGAATNAVQIIELLMA